MLFDATLDGRTVRVEVRGRDGNYTVLIDGEPLAVDYQSTGVNFASLLVDGRSHEAGLEKTPTGYRVVLAEDALDVELKSAARGATVAEKRGPAGPARLNAPMPGRIVKVLCAAGDDVAAGQGLVVMEAMKMENELRAPRAGRVQDVRVVEGQAVETGALLVVVE